MKKVRFVTPKTNDIVIMSDSECYSPRPFIERKEQPGAAESSYDRPRVVPYNNEPLQRYEFSNSSPYPTASKSRAHVPPQETGWKPSDELDLSLLDASSHEPRPQACIKSALKTSDYRSCDNNVNIRNTQVLSSITNNTLMPPNVLVKDNSFFIRRDNLDRYHMNTFHRPLHNQFNGLNIGKENNPLVSIADTISKGILQQQAANSPTTNLNYHTTTEPPKLRKPIVDYNCPCHHCIKTIVKGPQNSPLVHKDICDHASIMSEERGQAIAMPVPGLIYCHCSRKACACCVTSQALQSHLPVHVCGDSPAPQNPIDKKTWTIEKFEQRKQSECMEVDKQTNVTKEKREPTVADLFRIIKLQNEQLQLLQEKVDKFISTSQPNAPTISHSSGSMSLTENEQLKMSIGVMTSFEMVRTSTVINKEMLKHTNENQIQCNRSQISIKEVLTKPAMNFLDGIMPVNNPPDDKMQTDNGTDKTFNELSLYNIHVDNALTPNISPEQSMYLDVRDYSESDVSSNNQSNVGWTYYNKVMSHVNDVLQQSAPAAAPAARHKRVKFGERGSRAPPSDTSLRMAQLAHKYLPPPPAPPAPPAGAVARIFDPPLGRRPEPLRTRQIDFSTTPRCVDSRSTSSS